MVRVWGTEQELTWMRVFDTKLSSRKTLTGPGSSL